MKNNPRTVTFEVKLEIEKVVLSLAVDREEFLIREFAFHVKRVIEKYIAENPR